jgi:hypothetical protein
MHTWQNGSATVPLFAVTRPLRDIRFAASISTRDERIMNDAKQREGALNITMNFDIIGINTSVSM